MKNKEASYLDEWLDNQTDAANNRIPYASTLQLNDEGGDEMIETIENRDVPIGF